MGALLGCIGDDFTGSTDLANTLARQGMRTIQLIGVPKTEIPASGADALVVALKSRNIPAPDAAAQSIEALNWLKAAGCRQFFFKYCSTFDSTDQGNIGPVAEALLDALGAEIAIACPAFPETGRTIYKGHLFVGDVPLSESGMKDHPLTPMTDSNLVRVLGRQVKGPVGLVPLETVQRGAGAIRASLADLCLRGVRFAVVDAITDRDLYAIGEAVAGQLLVTGGSGVALGLPENFRGQGLLPDAPDADRLPLITGKAAVLAGSCSTATQIQVAAMKRVYPARKLDLLALAENPALEISRALAWALPLLSNGPVLIYSTDNPASVSALQGRLGRERAGQLAEQAQAEIACGLVSAGVRRLIVAGGETAGAVVNALGITGLRIGPQIDPGIPWTASLGADPLGLALKSGNFGAEDFFEKALKMLP